MNKGLALTAAIVCMGLGCFFAETVQAEEYTDRPITAMDENGNTYEVEAENGYVESDEITTYADSGEYIVNFNTSGSAVTNYTEAGTGEAGYTNGAYGADAAYLGIENGKVKFMLSGVVGYVSSGSVQVLQTSSVKSISHYEVSSGWLVHRISYNLNKSSYSGNVRVGYAPSYLSSGVTYYSYDGVYFYTSYAAMLQDYRNSVRTGAVNAGNPYYNYFQYLPLRSVTSYTDSSLNSAISSMLSNYGYSSSVLSGTGSTMINYQNAYGVNALLMTGIAANESGWGTSNISRTKNNLFGLNAVDDSPGQSANYFSSVEACIKEFAQVWMSQGYLDPEDGRYYGGFLGNKASGINVKYASDPYWGEKAAAAAWNLDAMAGGSDAGKYTIAVKDTVSTSHTSLNVYAESSSGSTALYQSGTQAHTSFLLMSTTAKNGFYMIQSDGLINGSRTGLDVTTGSYSFGNMYAYVSTSGLTIVNVGEDISGANRFSDVSSSEWYYEYVEYVYKQGIMTGYNSTTFGVSNELTRAEFAVIIYRLAGSPSVSYASVYSDVGKDAFYSLAAVWCQKNGIITGYENGMFGPSDSITREQIATIMYRYAKYKGYDTSQRGDLSGFPDAGSVSGFATEAVKWAAATSLITGDQGNINPQGAASRAHCATIVTRFMKNIAS